MLSKELYFWQANVHSLYYKVNRSSLRNSLEITKVLNIESKSEILYLNGKIYTIYLYIYHMNMKNKNIQATNVIYLQLCHHNNHILKSQMY